MKHKTATLVGVAAVALALAVPATAGAVESPGKNKDALIAFYGADGSVGSPTPSGSVDNLGQALAAGYLGNTSNSGNNTEDAPDSGHGVNPSSSPGPTVGGCDAEAGASIGHAITGNGPSDVPKGNIPDRC